MKPETKALREVLRAIGVRPAQVRTDTALNGTTATIFAETDIAALIDAAPALFAAGYGLDVRRDEDGSPYLALVTTDPRRAAGMPQAGGVR